MDFPPELIAAKQAAEPALLALPGVVGVGLGLRETNGEFSDELAVRVLVRDLSALPPGIPDTIGGVSVCIVAAPDIQACVLPPPDTSRYAPLVGGIQIVQPSRGIGTLGCIVQDSGTGELLGLSCYHVVGGPGETFPDTIWQPKNPPLLHGLPISRDDNIGETIRVDFPRTPPLPFSPILVGMVDAAVIRLGTALNQGRALSAAIVGQNGGQQLVDRIMATEWPSNLIAGTDVLKRGAITRVTSGRLISAMTTLQWAGAPPNCYLMEQSEIAGDSGNPDGLFAQPGDSGSLVVLKDTPSTALGLLWGIRGGGLYGIMSAIRNVESQLSINTAWV